MSVVGKRIVKLLIVQPLLDLHGFLTQSVQEFSLTFMLIIGLTYFLQGFRSYAFGDGIIWFFSNVFQLDPGPTQLYMSTIFITWNIKMLYGLVFDNFPLFRRKDVPYLVISGMISCIGFLALGVPSLTSTPDVTTVWFFLALMGLAMSDVIADAMVVRQAREAGAAGGADLQAYCWVLSSIGGIIGRPLAGYITGTNGNGSRMLLGVIYSASSALGCIVSLMHKEQPCTDASWTVSKFWDQLKRLVFAIIGNTNVWMPMVWIVCGRAIVPDVSAAMNFWKRDVIGVGADTKAYIDTVGDVVSISGLVVYTKYFKKTRFSVLFFWTQIGVAVFALTDVVLVYRWNRVAGLSDELFLIGSGTIIHTLHSFQAMPFLVLAAQLCPKDIEATFYAAMMSLGNVGANLGNLYGGYLLTQLHIVQMKAQDDPSTAEPGKSMYDFTYLPLALWIRVVSMGVSALFVFWLVPNSPEDVVDGVKRGGDGGVVDAEWEDGMDEDDEAVRLVPVQGGGVEGERRRHGN
ncbi:hypothetical protein HDU80_003991 [Chytriomyces hyalinus]|nr:hypothetical protein HDU80_003991 [Chytriomyces hyalinus]